MIRLPDDPSAANSLADWLEASLLSLKRGPFRISDAQVASEFRDLGLDTELSKAELIAEVRRRHDILGLAYPFERDGTGFTLVRVETTWAYRFLLLVSLNQSYGDLAFRGDASGPAELFEFVVMEAMQRYISGSAVRLGAHRRAPIPSALPAAIRFAAQEMKEEETYGLMEEHDAGDDGCDVIAWKPFADAAPSQLIVLAQCAVGIDWAGKRSELDLDLWAKHIGWFAKPLKAFAVPFVHEPGQSWRETSTRGGILFDRLRLTGLVDGQDPLPDQRAQLQAWCQRRIVQVQSLALRP